MPPAERGLATSSFHPVHEIRSLTTIEELHACEAIAKVVWQVDDREIVPASYLRAQLHGGGMVAGAFDEGRMVGFVVGFLARHAKHEPVGLHSHLLGVLSEYRRSGLGRSLKWFQRRWSLEHGLPWITWTFDPLQAHNARLNLEHLGAEGESYHADFYGTLGGVLFGSLATDRLVARWELESPRVLRLAGGAAPEPEPRQVTPPPVALARTPDDAPAVPILSLQTDTVRVAVPTAFAPLLYQHPERAAAWRSAVRATMGTYMERGYRARRFHDGAYWLERAT